MNDASTGFFDFSNQGFQRLDRRSRLHLARREVQHPPAVHHGRVPLLGVLLEPRTPDVAAARPDPAVDLQGHPVERPREVEPPATARVEPVLPDRRRNSGQPDVLSEKVLDVADGACFSEGNVRGRRILFSGSGIMGGSL
jgi:hypothetical protein